MIIKLPKKFEEILGSGEYRAWVETVISRLKPIYIENKLEFFKDYTNHGLDHIQEVLETAAAIIDEDSFDCLNEKDVAVLVVSVLLHDIGMQISNQGLKKLLNSQFDKYRVKEFDKYTWREEWTSFYQEAKRFNDEQMINIFGSGELNISEPDIDNLDDNDRRLYGEFLRRLHQRLAHEIAIGGFPTKENEANVSLISPDVDEEIVDIAGLIARSHGIPVRSAVDYLEKKYSHGWRNPYKIKVVFVMIVLRIADYLQIHSERASKIILKSKRFASPISLQEWEKHNAVKDININTDDPERIFVLAKPHNSKIFLELEKLFLDIQSELDLSWAILGEAYGKDDELKKLKIKFRRIKSVLDDKEQFASKIDYIPERIFFNADPELLKLLISPLYGDDPKYGIRELLQNSIDAIKEREYINGNVKSGKVKITLKAIKKDKPRYEILISDNGIGMTKDTIINYFFKAGASFRTSMSWKKNFTEGKEVQVQKTGRFGVGVLAVFLLGDEFEMRTRYDSQDSQGYYCSASLGMTQVELKKEDCEVGTSIRIVLKDSVNAILNTRIQELGPQRRQFDYYYEGSDLKLDWFKWYYMDYPEIDFEIEDALKGVFNHVEKKNKLSHQADSVKKNWRAFNVNGYKGIHWIVNLKQSLDRFQRQIEDFEPTQEFFCNGFNILRGYKITDKTYDWGMPIVSVFDNNAALPLSLSRDYIQDDKLPFENELLESVSMEVIKALLKTEFEKRGPYFVAKNNIIRFFGEINLSDYIVVLNDEYTLLHKSLLGALNVKIFDQVWFRNQADESELNYHVKRPYQAIPVISDSIQFYKSILEGKISQGSSWFKLGDWPRFDDIAKYERTFISRSKLNFLLEKKRLNQEYKKGLKWKNINGVWIEIFNGESSFSRTIIPIDKLSPSSYPLIIQKYISSKFDEEDFFIKTWKKCFGSEWTFPIDEKLRPELPKNDR